MIKVQVILNHLANFFGDASIVRMFTLMLHMCEAVAIGTLMKVNTFVSGVVFETPSTLFDSGFLIVPPICEGVGGALGLGSFLLGDFSRDVVNDRRGDVIIGVSSS